MSLESLNQWKKLIIVKGSPIMNSPPSRFKNEPCEDDVIYIEEPEENEEKFFESSLCTLKKSSKDASMRPGPRGWWCPLSWRGSGTRAA